MEEVDFDEDFYMPDENDEDFLTYINSVDFERGRMMDEIDTIMFNTNNVLDEPVDELIESKRLDILELMPQIGRLEKERSKEGLSEDEYIDIQIEIMDIEQEKQYKEEELFALYEVKIIYAFKHFEINLKKLLSKGYGDNSIKKFYKWHNFIDFLSSKGISIMSIEGYKEVDQLRNVSNSFKHSGSNINDSIRNIEEFRAKNYLTYKDLERFYSRIEDSPDILIKSLVKAVQSDLFEFDDKKLDIISDDLACRMDEETAKKFIESFQKHYE